MVERVIVGPWKTNCYIYSSSKKECIIIDPGGDEAEIASRVDVLNMVPVGIALTHGHVDHLAALGRLRESYASRGYSLPIGISAADRRFLGVGAMEAHKESLKLHAMDELSFALDDAPELPKADVKLKEGDRVFNMDLVVLETPGHTPGSLCFYSEKEGVLFSGDTLFFDGVGRTDMPGGSDKKLRESIQKKIAVLPPETRVFPGHGPFTTVERERRGNPFLREPTPEPRRPEPQRPLGAQISAAVKPVAGKPVAVTPARRVKPNRQAKPARRAATARTAKPARPVAAVRSVKPARNAKLVKPARSSKVAPSKQAHHLKPTSPAKPAKGLRRLAARRTPALKRAAAKRPVARSAKKKARP